MTHEPTSVEPPLPRRDGPSFSVWNRLARQIWTIAWILLFKPSPRPFHGWRRVLLRCFGATVGPRAHVYAGARIWAPWKLVIGEGGSIADNADVYNPAGVVIGPWAVVSQGVYLCGASHDYESPRFPLIAAPINIGAHAWVAARAIVHMNVTLGDGCVVGAGSVVTRDMPSWTVCVGVPCRPIRKYRRRTEE